MVTGCPTLAAAPDVGSLWPTPGSRHRPRQRTVRGGGRARLLLLQLLLWLLLSRLALLQAEALQINAGNQAGQAREAGCYGVVNTGLLPRQARRAQHRELAPRGAQP